MRDTAKRVLVVWASLTRVEREQAIKLIKEYEDADTNRKKEMALEALNESRLMEKASTEKASTTMNFGPLNGRCPYCGK
jgi:hypothetical protein